MQICYNHAMGEQYLYWYDPDKNTKLKQERGVCFENVIWCIENNYVLDILPHHNQKKYPNQFIMLILVENYVYQVPFEFCDGYIELKTLFASRKFTRKYIGNVREIT